MAAFWPIEPLGSGSDSGRASDQTQTATSLVVPV